MSIEENKDWFKQHLIMFYRTIQYYKQKSELEKTDELGPGPLADIYIENEISMERGWREHFNYLESVKKYNTRILMAIKSVKGKTFYKYLKNIIEESDRIDQQMEIVPEPTGDYQKECYGRTIPGIWVDQRSVGDSGDSYAGSVCILLKPNKYLKFYYSC